MSYESFRETVVRFCQHVGEDDITGVLEDGLLEVGDIDLCLTYAETLDLLQLQVLLGPMQPSYAALMLAANGDPAQGLPIYGLSEDGSCAIASILVPLQESADTAASPEHLLEEVEDALAGWHVLTSADESDAMAQSGDVTGLRDPAFHLRA